MKVKIKFSAINCQGKKVSFIKNIKCPDFKIIPAKVLNGIQMRETSTDEQIIDWYDTVDKKQLMNEIDLYIILDYEILKPRKQKITLLDLFKAYNISDKLAIDLLAVYAEIKPTLKGKTAEQKLKILISHANIGYKAASNAYSNVIDVLNIGLSTNIKKINNENTKRL